MIFVYALTYATQHSWGSAVTLGLLAISASCSRRSSRSSGVRRRR